jgi:Flp pilus assembly protein TadD
VNDPQYAAARQRLERLEGFLQQDADNANLRADAFYTALQCGEWDRAGAQLEWARAAQPHEAAWALREGDWLLAQKRYPEAREFLQQLRAQAEGSAPLQRVIEQNLGFIAFSEQRFAEAVALLRPLAEDTSEAPAPTLQQLWLRALHHAGDVSAACDWAAQVEARGQLDAGAAGIAALAAIDRGDFAAAQRWCRLAESGGATHMEALVARSSIALAVPDAGTARQLAMQATQLNPRDGRAWSARAFAELLAGDLAAARASFAQALAFMPQHIGTWHGQGWLQVLQKDLVGARATFEHAVALDRNFAESHGGLAVALAMQGDKAAAREHIELAQRLDRANLSSRYAEAILSGEAQDAQAIQRLAQKLLGARKAPLGGTMGDWLPPQDKTLH